MNCLCLEVEFKITKKLKAINKFIDLALYTSKKCIENKEYLKTFNTNTTGWLLLN